MKQVLTTRESSQDISRLMLGPEKFKNSSKMAKFEGYNVSQGQERY